MSCDQRFREFCRAPAITGAGTKVAQTFAGVQAAQQALDEIFRTARNQPALTDPRRQVVERVQTKVLFEQMKKLGIEPPAHGSDGLPKPDAQRGYAAIWQTLDAIEKNTKLPAIAEAIQQRTIRTQWWCAPSYLREDATHEWHRMPNNAEVAFHKVWRRITDPQVLEQQGTDTDSLLDFTAVLNIMTPEGIIRRIPRNWAVAPMEIGPGLKWIAPQISTQANTFDEIRIKAPDPRWAPKIQGTHLHLRIARTAAEGERRDDFGKIYYDDEFQMHISGDAIHIPIPL